MKQFLTIIIPLLLVVFLFGCSADEQKYDQPATDLVAEETASAREERVRIDYEFITMDRTKPILPSVKESCLSAFLSSDSTQNLTLCYLCLSEDELSIFVEAIAEDYLRVYFEYNIANNTISLMDPQPETLLTTWDNCYTNNIAEGKAIAARVIDSFDNASLNPSLYHTMLQLIPVTLTKAHIDALTNPTVCVFPFANYYCLRVDYKEADLCYAYQIFCDYEDNVLEKQGYDFSLSEITTTYYGDLEEWTNPELLTVWSDERIQLVGQVHVEDNRYYLKITPQDILLIEYRERFDKSSTIYFHDDLSEYVGTAITVEGYINNYRGGGSLYLEEISIVNAD